MIQRTSSNDLRFSMDSIDDTTTADDIEEDIEIEELNNDYEGVSKSREEDDIMESITFKEYNPPTTSASTKKPVTPISSPNGKANNPVRLHKVIPSRPPSSLMSNPPTPSSLLSKSNINATTNNSIMNNNNNNLSSPNNFVVKKAFSSNSHMDSLSSSTLSSKPNVQISNPNNTKYGSPRRTALTFNTSPKNQNLNQIINLSPTSASAINFSTNSNNAFHNNSPSSNFNNYHFGNYTNYSNTRNEVESRQEALITDNHNNNANGSIHTFSSQPSPSQHQYLKNKKMSVPSTTQQQQQVIRKNPLSPEHQPNYNYLRKKKNSLPPIKTTSPLSPTQTSTSPLIPTTTTSHKPLSKNRSTSLLNKDEENETQIINNATTNNNNLSPKNSKKVKTEKKKKEKNKKTSIKNYKKGDIIGQGASGKVFLGFNLDNGQFFAIKECTFDNVPEDVLESKLAALQREINVMKELKHENIVQYYGAEILGTTLNIFLEYVPGGSVASLLKKYGRLSGDLVRQYTKQILKGLKYLHDNRIVHRDIKGANILVSIDGDIKLADFGASRKIQDIMTLSNEFKSLMGTPYFMAPEVIMQTGHGRSADIWSIGCTVVEMYTGKPPFVEYKTAAAVMFHIASSNVEPAVPDFVSEDCKRFLAKCFIRDPEKRATAEDLLNDPWICGGSDSDSEEEEEQQRTITPSALMLSDEEGKSFNTIVPVTDNDFDENPMMDPNEPSNVNNKIKDIPLEKNPIQPAIPQKGYDDKRDINKFLRQNSAWQSRSFSSKAWKRMIESYKQQQNEMDFNLFEEEEDIQYRKRRNSHNQPIPSDINEVSALTNIQKKDTVYNKMESALPIKKQNDKERGIMAKQQELDNLLNNNGNINLIDSRDTSPNRSRIKSAPVRRVTDLDEFTSGNTLTPLKQFTKLSKINLK
ncbi:hypothetical protein ABK040_001079 [Willaertia magna]